jgi:N-acetylneuraminic acid mutarotase
LKEAGDWAFGMIDDGIVKHKSVVFSSQDVSSEDKGTLLRLPKKSIGGKEGNPKQQNCKIYTFGGLNSEGIANNMLWLLVFDGLGFHSEPLHTLGTRPEPRYDHAMVALEEYKVIAIHGGRNQNQDHLFSDLFVFVPESLTWSRVIIDKPLELPSISNHCIMAAFSEIFILGGLNMQGYSTFDIYRLRLRREGVVVRNSYRQTNICKR